MHVGEYTAQTYEVEVDTVDRDARVLILNEMELRLREFRSAELHCLFSQVCSVIQSLRRKDRRQRLG